MPNTHVITSNGRARIEVDHAIASRLVARGVAMLDGERHSPSRSHACRRARRSAIVCPRDGRTPSSSRLAAQSG